MKESYYKNPGKGLFRRPEKVGLSQGPYYNWSGVFRLDESPAPIHLIAKDRL